MSKIYTVVCFLLFFSALMITTNSYSNDLKPLDRDLFIYTKNLLYNNPELILDHKTGELERENIVDKKNHQKDSAIEETISIIIDNEKKKFDFYSTTTDIEELEISKSRIDI